MTLGVAMAFQIQHQRHDLWKKKKKTIDKLYFIKVKNCIKIEKTILREWED